MSSAADVEAELAALKGGGAPAIDAADTPELEAQPGATSEPQDTPVEKGQTS
jgi:hypothetical protein